MELRYNIADMKKSHGDWGEWGEVGGWRGGGGGASSKNKVKMFGSLVLRSRELIDREKPDDVGETV